LAFPGDVADRHWGGLSMGTSESESHHGWWALRNLPKGRRQMMVLDGFGGFGCQSQVDSWVLCGLMMSYDVLCFLVRSWKPKWYFMKELLTPKSLDAKKRETTGRANGKMARFPWSCGTWARHCDWVGESATPRVRSWSHQSVGVDLAIRGLECLNIESDEGCPFQI
jgi:hypothetical protein